MTIEQAQRLAVWARVWRGELGRTLARDDRGEGVISTAIAVLIMAFLGALMWVGFQEIWGDAQDRTREQVERIGG
jgi:hypothetical protein